MRRAVRFALGAGLGASALAAYLLVVGPGRVLSRATAVPPAILLGVALLVVAEALADAIGVWASVRPLGGGLTPVDSVRFALAGDFFDTLSPAGPVSSEPIMARFFAVATATTYGEALGVRGVAKYVKSGTQLLVSLGLVGLLLLRDPAPQVVAGVLGGAAVALLVVGVVLVSTREASSRALAAALGPLVRALSSPFRDRPLGRTAVADSLDRLWTRALAFREMPGLLALVALGGVLEQVLTALALWVALAGTGTAVALVPIVAVVPLPQAASAIPVPASLGAYDLLLAGALVVTVGASAAGAGAAVLVVRTLGLGVALGAGGLATALLRGWRPRNSI